MLPVLPANPRQSFGQKLNIGLGRGLESLSQMQQQNQQQQQMQQENQTLKQMGIDLTGITDPKARQEFVAAALQGANQQQLEMLKQQGKKDQIKAKEDYLSKLFGGYGKQQEQSDQPDVLQNKPSFDIKSISDEQIAQVAAVDPQMANLMQRQKDVALREERANQELDLKKTKMSPEYKREQQLESSQAQSDVKYNAQLQEASKQHALKEQTLDRLEQLNKKGVTGKPYEKFLEKMGLVNLTSEGRREFAADVKNLITDIRSILGGQFSNFEFQTILNAYPSADFSKEANEAIIRNLKQFQDIKSKEVDFARDIKKENGGKIPFDFQSQVNERVHNYAQTKLGQIKENTREIMNQEYGIPKGHTLMFDPKGEPMSVPDSDVEKILSLGGMLP